MNRDDCLAARRSRPRTGQRGLTLIELMVSLVIGLMMTLALFGVLIASEGRRRVGTGLNDLEQAGNIAMYQLDQWVRSAGSGFTAIAEYAYGCALYSKASGGQTLPLSAANALPAPFAAVDPDGSGRFALAPLVILPGSASGTAQARSDRLVVMGGAAGLGGAPSVMTVAPATGSLGLQNTLPFGGGELLLVADPNGSGSGPSPCMLTQVASSFTGGAATALALGGDFHAATIDSQSLTSYSADAVGLPIGHPTGNPPQFMLIGVGAHDTLVTYDLLKMAGSNAAVQARAQGVYEMHALYGVDTDDDGKQDSWAPASTGAYAAGQLHAGTNTATTLLRRIKAVRVGLILRLPLLEKSQSNTGTPASLTLFGDLADDHLALTRALSEDERQYRYRVIEATLVLRNNLLQELP